MTKKEKAFVEELLTQAALRSTADVAPDVPYPGIGSGCKELSVGFAFIGSASQHPRVEPACSSSIYHGVGQTDKTSSQGPRSLYSTRLLALRALRREVERECMFRLRRVDAMIEVEIETGNQADSAERAVELGAKRKK